MLRMPRWLYNAANWMGDNYVDPYTGNYIDPNTGLPVYRNYQVFPTNGNQQPNYNNSAKLTASIDLAVLKHGIVSPWAIQND